MNKKIQPITALKNERTAQPLKGLIVEIKDFSCLVDNVAVLESVTVSHPNRQCMIFLGSSDSGAAELASALSGILPKLTDCKLEGKVALGNVFSTATVNGETSRIGYVGPDPADQIVGISTDSELEWAWSRTQIQKGQLPTYIQQLLNSLEIETLIGRSTAKLSSGQRQRLAIASVAIANPDLLVLDNCFESLDVSTQQKLAEYVESRTAHGLDTWIAATPDCNYASADELVFVLAEGRLVLVNDGLPATSMELEGRDQTERSMLYNDLERLAASHCCSHTFPENIEFDSGDVLLWSEDGIHPRIDVRDFTIRGGECVGLEGKNGSGKSSFLAAIAKVEPSNGRGAIVLQEGIEVPLRACYLPPDGIPNWVLKSFASQYTNCSLVSGNVARVMCALKTEDRFSAIFDGSYRSRENPWRRLWWIAQSVFLDIPWMMLDEPTTGMDAQQRQLLADLIRHHVNRNGGVVVASHDRSFLREISHRCFTVERGKIHGLPHSQNATNHQQPHIHNRDTKMDARFKVLLGVTCNIPLFCPDLALASLSLLLALIVWFRAGVKRRILSIWIPMQLLVAAIFFVSFVASTDTADTAIRGFINWSAGIAAGLMIVAWPGVENVARIVLATPIPTSLSKAFGFSLRSTPILMNRIQIHESHRKMVQLLGVRKRLIETIVIYIGEVLSGTVDSIDKIVSQLEIRGYDKTMFGSLPPFGWTASSGIAICVVLAQLAILIVSQL